MPLNETHIYYQVFKFDKPQSFRAILPKITELCASDLHNYLVYVPCNVDKILEVRFLIDFSLKPFKKFKIY
jgi:hypothetical protein